MRFDVGKFASRLESRSPFLMKTFSMRILGLISPFNRHLKGRLIEWTNHTTQIEMACHRGVRNHVRSIHAGAIFTLGETCAGLIIVRNFSFSDFRPLMSEVSVVYHKQARGKITAVSKVSAASLKKIRDILSKQSGANSKKEDAFLPMQTRILNSEGEEIALVKTTWQIKPWGRVRKK